MVERIDLGARGRVEASPERFLASLRGPTLFRRAGRDPSRVRVASGLMHGNEPSGFRAVHRALSEDLTPETDVWFLVGAVEAALAPPGFAHRMLPGRRDLNRCWRAPFDGPDGEAARDALSTLLAVTPEAVVDLHNNTGRNPAYVLSSRVDAAAITLCGHFATRLVHNEIRLGTFVEAFDHLCPAATVECGRAGDPQADATAWAGLQRFLRASSFSGLAVEAEPVAVLRDPARVRLREGLSLAFAERPIDGVDVTFDAEVDRHNFETLAAGSVLAWVRPEVAWPVEAVDASGRALSRALFSLDAGALVTRAPMVPIMMTTSVAAATSDCLFYAAHHTG